MPESCPSRARRQVVNIYNPNYNSHPTQRKRHAVWGDGPPHTNYKQPQAQGRRQRHMRQVGQVQAQARGKPHTPADGSLHTAPPLYPHVRTRPAPAPQPPQSPGGGARCVKLWFGDDTSRISRRKTRARWKPRPPPGRRSGRAAMVANLRFLTLVKPVLHVLPEVAQPAHQVVRRAEAEPPVLWG